MAVSFNSLSQKARRHKRDLLKAWSSVVDSGHIFAGKEVTVLEKLLQNYLHQPWVKTVASGHDALLLVLQSLNLSSHQRVIVLANAYPSLFPILQAGYQPQLVDCDDEGQLSVSALEQVVNVHSKVVIATHLFGHTSDIRAIRRWCIERELILIEDCAQSLGTEFAGKMTGTFGLASCFSFYPTKNLGALGDGGAVATRSAKLKAYLSAAIQYGERMRYHSLFVSGHSRLPELQAAGLNIYLSTLPKMKVQRQQVREWYEDEVQELERQGLIRLLKSHPLSSPFYHLLVVQATQRDKLRAFLEKRNIPTLIHYPVPANHVPAFTRFEFTRGEFPMAERLCSSCISLPFHEDLTKTEVKFIMKQVQEFYETS